MTKLSPIQSALMSDGLTKAGCEVAHGFFTRKGGKSEGIYAGLNVGLGSDDDQAAVVGNRELVADTLSVTPEHLLTPYQVHSPEVSIIEEPWLDQHRPKADALVTAKPGIAIGILTADCGPVLFCDPENAIVGAAHAGWKGATGGVLENTILEMEKLGADRQSIHAVLGPTISAKHYEVGPEFVEMLQGIDTGNAQYLTPSTNSGHAMFDLPAYIVSRLKGCGVKAEWTGHCTYADETNFYSYRRKTHRDEPDYGRQISAIKITTRKPGA